MLLEPQTYDDLVAVKVKKYEEKIVKVLLKRFGIAEVYKYKMLAEWYKRYGARALNLDLFMDFFPTFPVELMTTYFPYVANKFTVADLFGRFGKTLLVERYDTCLQEHSDRTSRKPFGLVFNWPHLKGGGGLVLHNHRINVDVPGTRLLWVSNRGEQLVLETLAVLLDTIDNAQSGEKGWVPEPAAEYAMCA